MAVPIEPGLIGMLILPTVQTGEASVNPYPSVRTHLNFFENAGMYWGGMVDPPVMQSRRERVSNFSASSYKSMPRKTRGTAAM